MTFDDLQRQMFELYGAGRYAEALDLITREMDRFPEEAWRLALWRVCLATRSGEPGRAIALLQRAIDAGFFYDEVQLREDQDLAPLQGTPEFERLAQLSAERLESAQAAARPRLLTLEPAGGAGRRGEALLLAMHGNAMNAVGSARFWQPVADQGWLVGLAQSSQVAGPDLYVWNDLALAEREVCALYEDLAARRKLDAKRIVLGGFSTGARLAAWLTLRQAIPARGFVAVGPWIPEIDSWLPVVEGAKGLGLRNTIIVGDRDDDCFPGAQALAGLLDTEGIACDLQIVAGLGHDYPGDFAKRLERALRPIR